VVFLRQRPGALRICHFQKLSLPKFLKSAGYVIVIDDPLDVSDPVGSVLISIKSMEGLPAGLRAMRMLPSGHASRSDCLRKFLL
jgi:hypothetical protein